MMWELEDIITENGGLLVMGRAGPGRVRVQEGPKIVRTRTRPRVDPGPRAMTRADQGPAYVLDNIPNVVEKDD